MRVRFTRAAQRDLAQIHAYISQDSSTIASRVVARLMERARELADNPFTSAHVGSVAQSPRPNQRDRFIPFIQVEQTPQGVALVALELRIVLHDAQRLVARLRDQLAVN